MIPHLIDVIAGVGVLVELVLLDDELVPDHASVVDDHVRHRLDPAVHDDQVMRSRQGGPSGLVQRPRQQTRLRGLQENLNSAVVSNTCGISYVGQDDIGYKIGLFENPGGPT